MEPSPTPCFESSAAATAVLGQPVLPGVHVVPGFVQTLGHNPGAIWDALAALPTWTDSEPILHEPQGERPCWIAGTHSALGYRGNAIARDKIWNQWRSDFAAQRFRRYFYTGWQWRVLLATRAVEAMPAPARDFVQDLCAWYASCYAKALNHFIWTRYRDGDANIGAHQDKVLDFAPDTHFIVVKFGGARPFALWENAVGVDGKSRPGAPVFESELEAGTAVVVSAKATDGGDANSRFFHGVPRVAKASMSGSLVARVIDTTFPFDRVLGYVARKFQVKP